MMVIEVMIKFCHRGINKADYLKPLETDSNSEEDAPSKTKVAKTFSNGMDDFKDFVVSTKSNRKHKQVAQQKNEVSDTKTSKQVIEDVMHWPKIRIEKSSFE